MPPRIQFVGHCVALAVSIAGLVTGCCAKNRASVTAVPLSPWNQCEPEGIPYYLPKPLLIVAKNVRHIDEAKVGLTDPVPIPNSFDNQAGYADLKANVTFPSGGAAAGGGDAGKAEAAAADRLPERALSEAMMPSGRMDDGIAPDSFYTYQIVFVPDLSQKYGLRIKGGPGEIRAAMNLVNGWMYTGMGPFYLKDSSTAQNMMAFGVGSMFTGRGVADVLNEVADLAKVANADPGTKNAAEATPDLMARGQIIDKILASQTKVPDKMLNYAEVYIYEPALSPEGATTWSLIAEHHFDRQFFHTQSNETTKQLLQFILPGPAAAPAPANGTASEPPPSPAPSTLGAPPEATAPISFFQSGETSEGSLPTALQQPIPNADEPAAGWGTGNKKSAAAPPAGDSMRDPVIEEFERTMLKLPSSAAVSSAPVNDIDINVELGKRRIPFGAAFIGPKHQPPKRPQIKTRALSSRSSGPIPTVAGAPNNPGNSTSN